MTEFDINAFYSSRTEFSLKYVSLHQIGGKQSPCSLEIELGGSGFICVAQVVTSGLLGVIRSYKPCRMNNGQCPINQYKKSSLPNS